jgi:alkyl hydroperoxide reductase subunit AhpC
MIQHPAWCSDNDMRTVLQTADLTTNICSAINSLYANFFIAQEELFRLGRDKKIRVQAVYGGADIGRQIRGLKDRF